MLTYLLGGGKRRKVIGHEAMGLLLLVDSLWDWQKEFANAFDAFRLKGAEAPGARCDEPPAESWVRYGQWTRADSERAETIERRHQFFVERMHAIVNPQLKDPARASGQLEREVIYSRDQKRCQAQGRYPWSFGPRSGRVGRLDHART